MTDTPQPSTAAGRALLKRLVHNGIGPHENEPWLEARILAIEAEARSQMVAGIGPDSEHVVPAFLLAESEAHVTTLREALERLAHSADESVDLLPPLTKAWLTKHIIEAGQALANLPAAALERDERLVKEAVEPFVRFLTLQYPDGTGDWACAECRPASDMIVAGFSCVPHLAVRALLSTTQRNEP